ncbi:3-oxoacyl-ACP reductase FabG [Candidatus Aerophobetes bacterium]|nr:3-oxoacyl-ACP reductase FabG [Candidatus Aerophobetes bacterium]
MVKNAIVTGGSRGIGKAIAIALSKKGINVALTYRTDKEKALSVVRKIENNGDKALCIELDQKNRNNIRRVIEEMHESFGKINILVNNAAIAQEKAFETITDNDWDNMMEVNLRGPFILSQEVIPDMIEQGWGRIVNITSIGGQWGGYNQVHYAAAKAGLINLTKSLARIYSKDGITVNAIAPGLVATDMSQNELNTEAGKKKAASIPIGRIATAKEIANVVAFLASDEASYITGQTINVNGGMYFG